MIIIAYLRHLPKTCERKEDGRSVLSTRGQMEKGGRKQK